MLSTNHNVHVHNNCQSMLYMIVHGYVQDGPMDGCGDGEWRGQRYFTCLPGRGFFFPAATLRPDVRIPPSSYPNQAGPLRNRKLHVVMYIHVHESSLPFKSNASSAGPRLGGARPGH